VQLGTLIQNAESVLAAEVPLADGALLVGSAGGVAVSIVPTGDVTITNAGVTAIASGVIVNADVNASAAIDYSKMATMTGDVSMSANASAIGASKVTEAMLKPPSTVGLGAKRVAYALFDPTAVVGDRTATAHALAAIIPINSFVTGAWYWVETTLTSAADSATIALSIEGANDVTTAIAISDVSNPWDTSAKPVEGTPVVETTSTWLKTSAARAVTATVGVQALTGGKVHIWVEYVSFG
jgi:hypothetical protein